MNATEEQAKEFLENPQKKMLGMVRVSFAPYNSLDEVELFLNVIEDISKGVLKI